MLTLILSRYANFEQNRNNLPEQKLLVGHPHARLVGAQTPDNTKVSLQTAKIPNLLAYQRDYG